MSDKEQTSEETTTDGDGNRVWKRRRSASREGLFGPVNTTHEHQITDRVDGTRVASNTWSRQTNSGTEMERTTVETGNGRRRVVRENSFEPTR